MIDIQWWIIKYVFEKRWKKKGTFSTAPPSLHPRIVNDDDDDDDAAAGQREIVLSNTSTNISAVLRRKDPEVSDDFESWK